MKENKATKDRVRDKKLNVLLKAVTNMLVPNFKPSSNKFKLFSYIPHTCIYGKEWLFSQEKMTLKQYLS